MSQELGNRLFTFAVVADTHVNFGETECNSEFEINRRANGRIRHVVRDLNCRELAFVIHLGDVVHPSPAYKQTNLSCKHLLRWFPSSLITTLEVVKISNNAVNIGHPTFCKVS